jgi:hypothetical protein
MHKVLQIIASNQLFVKLAIVIFSKKINLFYLNNLNLYKKNYKVLVLVMILTKD